MIFSIIIPTYNEEEYLPVLLDSIKEQDFTDFRFGRATHGYLPELGPQPVFLAKGPSFKENVSLPTRPIVDEAPTYARLLSVELPEAQGTPITELLK